MSFRLSVKQNNREKKNFMLNILKIKNFSYDVPMAKTSVLVYWVSDHIRPAPGNFISTINLYDYYKIDIEKINTIAVMTELTFYKEIQQALLTNSFILAKTRKKGIRGFNGIKYESI